MDFMNTVDMKKAVTDLRKFYILYKNFAELLQHFNALFRYIDSNILQAENS